VLRHGGKLPTHFEKFIKDNPVLFPEFQDMEFSERKAVLDDVAFRQIHPSDLKTENEKLTHWDVTVKFVTDRGVSHEIVRHRPASYCQESTRYCNYAQDKFNKEITFIIPDNIEYLSQGWNIWKNAMKDAEDAYFKLLDFGLLPQDARGVLPTDIKTELVMTANLQEWKHFFNLRTAKAAHPKMREVAIPLLDDIKEIIPGIFE
jgi:thymidylate synthase (FAD)